MAKTTQTTYKRANDRLTWAMNSYRSAATSDESRRELEMVRRVHAELFDLMNAEPRKGAEDAMYAFRRQMLRADNMVNAHNAETEARRDASMAERKARARSQRGMVVDTVSATGEIKSNVLPFPRFARA